MGKRRTLTQQMLTAAVLSLDSAHRTQKEIITEIWRLFNIRIGRTQLSHWMQEWEILANVESVSRREAKQAVANTLVGEKMEELRSQIGGLNKSEGLIARLLDKADDTLNQIVLTPDLDTVSAVLAEAKTLMLVSSQVRTSLADIKKGMGEEKPDPDVGNLTPTGPNVLSFAEMGEKLKNV